MLQAYSILVTLALIAIAYYLRTVLRAQNKSISSANQDTLSRSREFLQLSQQVASIGSWDWDIANNTIHWSDEMCRMHGQDPATYKPDMESALDSYHPQDRERIVAGIQKSLQTGWSEPGEFRVRLTDGNERIEWVNWKTYFDAAGKPVRMIGVNADITARRHAEDEIRRMNAELEHRVRERTRALTESEERLQRALEGSAQALWDYNVTTGEIFLSDQWSAMIGGSKEPTFTTLDSLFTVYHPNDRKDALNLLRSVINGEQQFYHVELRALTYNGAWKWIESRGTVVSRGANDKALQMSGSNMDVTERKRIEQALRNSEEMLNYAQRIAHVGNYSVNIATGKTNWSDEIYRIYGYEPQSFLPEFARHVAPLMQPYDVARAKLLIDDLISSGKPYTVEYPIRRRDGSKRILFTEARLIGSAHDGSLSFIGTVQDITAFKESEQAAIKSREAAEQASRAKSDFLSSMSHELRTPLNAILGFSQLLELDSFLSGVQMDNVRQITHAGKHLLQLINDLLDLSLIETGTMTLNMTQVRLHTLIEDIARLAQPLCATRNIDINIQINNDTMVEADNTRLRQAILNLVSNAIKYNKPGGHVTIAATGSAGNRLRISVTDTGRGIPPDKASQLFEAFNRLGAERSSIEGTGIGLVITRRLIEHMRGTIGFESSPNNGSTFWIELPTIATAHAGTTANIAQHPEIELKKLLANENLSILYIEDNAANLMLVELMLANFPEIRFLSATTPSQGLELFFTHRPDIVLLDINLPEMNGYQVLEKLRKADGGRNLPVVAVTANAIPTDVARVKAAGFTSYLVKPLELTVFFATLYRLAEQILAKNTYPASLTGEISH